MHSMQWENELQAVSCQVECNGLAKTDASFTHYRKAQKAGKCRATHMLLIG